MIRRPPRFTQSSSSAASDVYKRQYLLFMTIERVLEVIKSKHPGIDLTMVELAYEVAEKAHAGQKRASGEDYIQHPLETAYRLAEMNIDIPTCLLYTSPSPRDRTRSRMPSSA